MSAYPGGVSKHELEARIKRLQADIRRLLKQQSGEVARQAAIQLTSIALDKVGWSDINGKPSTFPPDDHDHDGRYYTESEVDALLATIDAYTKAETDALFDALYDDIDGGDAESHYVGLHVDGGATYDEPLTEGVIDGGGA